MKIKNTFIVLSLLASLSLPVLAGGITEPYDSTKDITVAGEDANQNGIRDDVDLLIDNEIITGPALKNELRRYARALNRFISSKGLPSIINNNYAMDAPRYCSYALGVDDGYYHYSSMIYRKLINTPIRKLAIAKINRQLQDSGFIAKRNKQYYLYCENAIYEQ
ncbi:hypothetical protein [Photobacterium damselae]|nr:hypothetical protein [Photobacterium damselae]AWK84549.1 hypothetical protein BST98_21175 [Photobacterium damselae]MBE8127820.1 hypothetical protein [Photobacterium damselae subsp. piscicida]MCG3823436.1 hypothetical protein [Photobacterium damselae]TLS89833.1 hypothetical protein FD720_01305 [Photobacterium damselae subsp. damselae]WIH21840.1 hypothetical protein KQY33_20615 [Photobacterium damselae]